MMQETVMTTVSPYDTEAVLVLDNHCFDLPLTMYQYLKFRDRHNTRIIKIEGDSVVVGALYYELASGVISINRICVHPDLRRKGLGTQLIDYLVQRLYGQSRRILVARVPDNVLSAQLFFKAVGFRGETTVVYPKYENGNTFYNIRYGDLE